MGLAMLCEIVRPRESLVTLGADIWSLLRMSSDMSKVKEEKIKLDNHSSNRLQKIHTSLDALIF